MSNIELYQPLLETWLAVESCREELNEKPGWRRSSKLKKAIENGETKFSEDCESLVKKSYESWDSDDSLGEFLGAELDAIREHADESWHMAIQALRDKLVQLAEKEEKKGPLRRKLEKFGWPIGIGAAVAVMLILKWYWLVEVTVPASEPAGLVQRAETLSKVLSYDDNMDTQVRRGGWVKGILFWPIKPTDAELEHAAEFLWSAVEVYDYLRGESALCGATLSHNPGDDSVMDELKIARIAHDYVNDHGDLDVENSVMLLAGAYYKEFPCE